LDTLRKTTVAVNEAGGITQHIGAFSVQLGGRGITFLDTPGHAAFSEMRKRGAQVTDVVVLVVACDDGIMPQTIEAIKHTLQSNVPMIVAVNKCDKPGVDQEKILVDLLQHSVVVESMGGDVPAVFISGKTGKGLKELEETILAIADINDFRGDSEGLVEGNIIEAKIATGLGNAATVIVKRGTLKPGATIVAGDTWCKVKRLVNDQGKVVNSAGPSMPVEVYGWKELPQSGDEVLGTETELISKKVSKDRKRRLMLEESFKDIEIINQKKQLLKVLIINIDCFRKYRK
jgi:translation initiation factor IF-2